MRFGGGEESLERLVDEGDSFVAARDDDPLLHPRENAAQAQPALHRLLIQRAEPLGDFADVLGGDLIGRSLRVESGKLEVSAGKALDVLADALKWPDESMQDQPCCDGQGREKQQNPHHTEGALKR